MKTVIKTFIITFAIVGSLYAAYMMSTTANADPGPCPPGQRQCMIIPGYNAPVWTDPRWSDRRDGMPGQWGPNSGYTPITENPYGRDKCTYRIGC